MIQAFLQREESKSFLTSHHVKSGGFIMETALPDALRTFCWGVLHAIGMFDPAERTNEEKAEDPAEYRTWFCLGETCMAALLAADIAVPAGFWFAGITALPLAFIGAAVLFLPLFVFLEGSSEPERGEERSSSASCQNSSGRP
jgi:hypothetical protein